MAMANTNGGKQTPKKLTADQKKLVKVVKRIGAVDKKPTTVESGNKSGKLATAKDVKKASAKKPSATAQSAKSHQKDLAKMSGGTAARKASKGGANFDTMAIKGSNAENKTRKSFGLKSRSARSEY